MKAHDYKRDCHRLMEEIWGWDKKGRSIAYSWLKSEMGMEVHFSEINDIQLLRQIHDKLFSYSVLLRNKVMVETIAPEWDLWIDHHERRNSRRFNRKKSGHLRAIR